MASFRATVHTVTVLMQFSESLIQHWIGYDNDN